MIRTALIVFAATTTIAVAQQTPIPPPRAVQCQNFVAINESGAVQHYEDCTPTDGRVLRCEVINATDARGRVRRIQNCALVEPANR